MAIRQALLSVQFRCVATGLAVMGCSALPAQTLSPGMMACVRIADNAARLGCFDREAALAGGPHASGAAPEAAAPPISPAPAVLSPTPAASAPTAPAVALTPEEKFGLSEQSVKKIQQQQGTQPPEITSQQAHIASLRQSVGGRVVLTLDNGQVWQQAEDAPEFVVHIGDLATITTGAFGSYWLATNPHNATKVRRVR